MKNTFFFRNVSDLKELLDKTKLKLQGSRNLQAYHVIGSICLSKSDYEDFSNNFRYNHKFLFEFMDRMKIANDIWHCVQVDCELDNGILVMNGGYSHPLYVALPQEVFNSLACVQ